MIAFWICICGSNLMKCLRYINAIGNCVNVYFRHLLRGLYDPGIPLLFLNHNRPQRLLSGNKWKQGTTLGKTLHYALPWPGSVLQTQQN